MAKVLVITSGKGGVGKTTSTAALGAALAQSGESVVVIDFDVGLRNLDLVMGAERRVVFDLINVVHGVAKLQQALIRDKRIETLWLLPASQTRDKDALTEDGVETVIAALREKFDWVICDSPAGIERGAHAFARPAQSSSIQLGERLVTPGEDSEIGRAFSALLAALYVEHDHHLARQQGQDLVAGGMALPMVPVGLLVGAAHQAAVVEIVALGNARPELCAAFHCACALVGLQMDVGAIERKGRAHMSSSASLSA